jgi:hypothetical protein
MRGVMKVRYILCSFFQKRRFLKFVQKEKNSAKKRIKRGQKIFKRALKFFQKNRARAFFFSSSLVFC